jgi:acetylornithine deacetylase/succinyl-diaminopimelate desuccinylase-like protein
MAHYDVQPPLDEAAWRTLPFELTEVDGRWYGRGAADCKGNIAMHLTAFRALGEQVPVNLKLVVEGSEETTGALEGFVPGHADLLRADAFLVGDAGNAAVGHPAITVSLRGVADVIVHVEALASELHSGKFGGAAPAALAALVAMLATLRDAHGNTAVHGLESTQTWPGAPWPPETFWADAGVLEGVSLLGDGTVPCSRAPTPDAELILMGVEEPQARIHPQRERRSGRDSGDSPDRGAVPATLRGHPQLTLTSWPGLNRGGGPSGGPGSRGPGPPGPWRAWEQRCSAFRRSCSRPERSAGI